MKRPFLLCRVLGAVFIAAVELLLLSVGPISCSMAGSDDSALSFRVASPGSTGGAALKVQSSSPPVLRSFLVDSSSGMTLEFDKLVSITDASLCPSDGGTPVSVSCDEGEGGMSVRLRFSSETKIGVAYDLKAVAHDADGNTLGFSVSFDGYNANLPDLVLCEVRNAYSSKANKYEFVRLYCSKAGNLSGLELLSAGDGEAKSFVFPAVEVSEGEYVCVHLRKMKDEDGAWKQQGMTDEDCGDIRASTAVDSSDGTWDFWQDNQKSRLSPSDIVMLRNRTDGRVVDAFLFRDPKKEAADWDGKYASFLKAVEQSGRWLDGEGNVSTEFESAFVAEGITSSAVTRTMRRRKLDAGPSSAADWCVEKTK
ncbi:MAG: hypothetical protein ILP18_04505 [Treponema sp.]|nr:hypothetical protein [Treponema sp.]